MFYVSCLCENLCLCGVEICEGVFVEVVKCVFGSVIVFVKGCEVESFD